MDNKFLVSIGLKISDMRNNLGLSQEKFSKIVGISKNYLGNIELGKQSPTILMLKKITDKLEISLSEFFKDIWFLCYCISMKEILYFYSNFQLPNPLEFVKAYLELKGETNNISEIFTGASKERKQIICEYFNLKEEITEQNIFDFLFVFRKYVETGKIEYSKEILESINTLVKNSILETTKEFIPLAIELYLNDFKKLIFYNIKGNFLNLVLKKWHKFHKEKFDLVTFLDFFSLAKDKDFIRLVNRINNFENYLALIILGLSFLLFFIISIHFNLE